VAVIIFTGPTMVLQRAVGILALIRIIVGLQDFTVEYTNARVIGCQ
jgi:hypothetical protein